ncbi:hypothetical protein KIH74_24055 [Kineosporia sp. J2-2]|uniref:GH26 domain-containing protein n=1 Tax=Kineosporia corallincola TaxID=2835133 RepID=A0ABS5TLR3_9ACTN|nr:glycosyl hydrolase [Kineosporia corallincola]MBT0772038.1 hypothetical protein [Kineosporia corallincola]
MPTTNCVYTAHSLERLVTFERNLGRSLDCVLVFNDAMDSWEGITDPWFIGTRDPDHAWAAWAAGVPGRTLVIGQGLVPTGSPADWRARGARGEYDQHFRLLGQRLVAAGLGSSVIRLGHEANGTWFFGNIGDTDQDHRDWAAYWARAANILHATPGANFRLDWTVSSGQRAVPLASWYPGDDAVDVIGIDQYDTAPEWVGQEPRARWDFQRTQAGGPQSVLAFARSRGKPVSVPEWGPLPDDPYGGGDNTYYVTRMTSLFDTENVVYQGFWDKTGNGRTTASELAPQAFAVYRDWLLSRP